DVLHTAAEFYTGLLPREVGEGLIGVGHAVDVLAFGEGGPFLVVRGRKLLGELQVHRPTLLFAGRSEYPADGQRLLPVAIHLHRPLVRSTTYAAAANLDERLDVLHRGREDLDRIAIRHLFLDQIESRIENVLRDALLAVVHQAVDELGSQKRLEFRIRTERRG